LPGKCHHAWWKGLDEMLDQIQGSSLKISKVDKTLDNSDCAIKK